MYLRCYHELSFVLAVDSNFDSPVADPGFPRGGGAKSPGGRQHTILPNFPKNCMKLKEFGPGGVRPKFYYVDPPLFPFDFIISDNKAEEEQKLLSTSTNNLGLHNKHRIAHNLHACKCSTFFCNLVNH